MSCRPIVLSVLILMMSFISASSVSAAILATGVYDEQLLQPNGIEVSATTDTGLQLSLPTFSAMVFAAFDADHGGVVNFDDGALNSGSSFTATYGRSHIASITISDASSSNMTRTSAPSGSTAVSGTYALGKTGGGGSENDFIFNIPAAAQVTAVAATFLSRDYGVGLGNITALASYTDGTNSGSVTSFVSDTNGGDDTFFAFRSPDGAYISQFRINVGSVYFGYMDDFAFITLPEPATPSLLLIFTLALLPRRKARAALINPTGAKTGT